MGCAPLSGDVAAEQEGAITAKLSRMTRNITIHLLKPAKGTTITYNGTLLLAEPGHLLVHARWERATLDLGYTTFEPGDHFYEHYYTERWFNVFEVRSAAGELKGWYCNITRPAHVVEDVVTSEDL